MRLRFTYMTVVLLGLGCPDEGPLPVGDASSATASKALATLGALKGPVTLTHQGASGPAAAGPVFAGDVVETGEGGSASLTFADGRVLELGSDGRIELGADNDGILLSVGRGVVVTRSGGTPAAPGEETVELSVETAYGLVRIGRAGLQLEVREDGVTIDVQTGNATIVARNGNSVDLQAGAGGNLSREGATRRVTLEPMEVVLMQSTGRIEVTRRDGKRLKLSNPKGTTPLGEGDTVRVAGGSATLGGVGSEARITLETGASVEVGQSQGGGNAEDVALALQKGTLVMKVPFGQRKTLRPAPDLEVTAGEGGTFSVTRKADGLEVSSVVGDLEVTPEGRPATRLKGGQTATVGSAGISAVDPVREALTLPTRNGLSLLHPAAERVALVWPENKDGRYHLTVSSDASFSRPLVDGIVHQAFFNLAAPSRGVLFWKVQLDEDSKASGSLVCRPERAGEELGNLNNQVPAGPEKTVIYFQDKPPALTFLWKAPEQKVAKYLLRVYQAGQFEKPLHERSTPATSVQLPAGAIGDGAYQWDVTWLDAAGKPVGSSGKMSVLELQYDNQVRRLVITEPKNGDRQSARVPVAGVAPLGSKVAVNGQNLELEPKGRFAGVTSPISGGRVVFRWLGEDGETYIVRVLRRGAK